MKKYFAYFIYDDDEYVIRFKIDGSLEYNSLYWFFRDKDLYIHWVDEVVCLAGGPDLYWEFNHISACRMISHNEFVRMRSNGVKRWGQDKTFVIHWD